jgi:hypothetical protein
MKPMTTTLDELTLATVPIQSFFNDTPLSTATSFVYRRRDRDYLITNWHVVTGRNAITGDSLCLGARPDRLRAQFNVQHASFGKREIDIKLRDEEAPLWLVHRNHHDEPNSRIDVVAIPLDLGTDRPPAYPVNDCANDKLKIIIGMDVFILGYPFGAKPPGFPVWKRGSIASEPDLVRRTTGYYLIDTASRPGMSGSPVILRSWTSLMAKQGVVAIQDRPLNRFIGVYSGRLSTEVSEAQIGIVWHESFIPEIIDGNRPDA